MSKGEVTREAIVDHALERSSLVGLAGLTIGGLAQALAMSKSGLFAHFRSKEALQLEVVEAAGRRFVEAVIRPALTAPVGLPRVRQVFRAWLAWERASLPGGCFFVQASAEVDAQPGVVRDRVVGLQRQWLEWLTECCRRAQHMGDIHGDVDPAQFAYTLYSLMLGYHLSSRLLQDPEAERRVWIGFEDYIHAVASGAR